MKPLFEPRMQAIPFEGRSARHDRRWIILLLGLTLIPGIILYGSTHLSSAPPHVDPTTALSETLIELQARYTPLSELTNGDEGYIAVDDIQSHPLLTVYIDPTVMVSHVPDASRIVHLTIVDNVIVLDPISVQQAIRHVAIGPDHNRKHVVLSSTAWLQTSEQPSNPQASPADGRRGTRPNGQD
ncbi:MAG: hypothetical protein Q8S75_20445 [Nitrospirota bacterium]|nr:hypothetical protein [Nitrospirota bacterium]